MEKIIKRSAFWGIVKVEEKITKGGAPDARLNLRQFIAYINKVYHLVEKINRVIDNRKRRSYPAWKGIILVLLGLILQYPSFYQMFSYSSSRKKWAHCIRGKIPEQDAIRDMMAAIPTAAIAEVNESIVRKVRRNDMLKPIRVDGLIVCAIDGVEIYRSSKKSCKDCLTVTKKDGTTEYFHRSVVCMTVGGSPHVILGQEMCQSRDGAEKAEGEFTAAHRLVKRLYGQFHHYADVIVADALYMNAPFVNLVHGGCGMDVVIRAKDENRLIVQDAMGLIRGKGADGSFQQTDKKNRKRKIEIFYWDVPYLEMTDVKVPVRFLQFIEFENGIQKDIPPMWAITTLDSNARTVWKIMKLRWEIENNGFHQLKTYYHASHCFCHKALETIFEINIMAFNLRELYLYRHLKKFKSQNMTRIEVTMLLRDSLLTDNCRKIIDDG